MLFLIIIFRSQFWEQKASFLLNKINEFVNKQSINYKVQELQESLILKLEAQKGGDSIHLINALLKIF